MNPEEKQLVLLAQRGDQPAFGALVDGYQGLVFAVALNVTGNWSDSEDVVQETFLRAWLKLRSLAEPAAFASWLCTIARRAALDLLRRRRIPTLDIDTELARQVESHDETPAEAFARHQLNELLWAEVAELPCRSREAILLFYMEGYSLRRAAAFLEISESAFKARLDYGRRLLRAGMERRLEIELAPRRVGIRRRTAIMATLPAIEPSAHLAGVLPLQSAAKVGLLPAAIGAPWLIGAMLMGLALTALTLQSRFGGIEDANSKTAPEIDTAAVSSARRPETRPATNSAAYRQPLSETRRISGQVTDLQYQRPVSGIAVALMNDAAGPAATTDAQGRFEFSVPAPGAYEIALVPAQDLLQAAYEPDDGLFSPIHVRVENRDVTGLAFRLVPRRWMMGKVVDKRTGSPISGVRLRRFDERIGWAEIRSGLAVDAASTHTNDQGGFRLPCPREAPESDLNFSVVADADGYLPMLLTEAKLIGGGIQPDRLVLSMTPDSGASLAGRFVDGRGRPWAYRPLLAAYLEFQSFQSPQPLLDFHRLIHTDADGRFEIESVPGGSPIRLNWEWWRLDPSTFQQLGNREITVEFGARLDMGDIVIDGPEAAGTLAGTLTDASGNPLANRCVYAGHESAAPGIPMIVAATTTDAAGRWQLAHVPEQRPLDFHVDRDDGLAIRNVKKIALDSCRGTLPPASGLALRLPSEIPSVGGDGSDSEPHEFLSVSGRLIDEQTGRPITQFDVTAAPREERRALNGQSFSKTFHHPGGIFDLNIPAFPPEVTHLLLRIKAAGYEERIFAYPRNLKSRSAPIAMKPGFGRVLRGTVVNIEGKPVHGASVALPALNRGAVYSRSDGTFELSIPAPSDRNGENVLQLHFEHPDYAAAGRSVRIDPSPEAPIDPVEVRLPPASAVTGVIVDSAMRPVVGQSVDIVAISRNHPVAVSSPALAGYSSFKAITDDQGIFRIDRIPPGQYQAETGDRAKSGHITRRFELSADRVADISFGTGSGSLKGRVLNGNGDLVRKAGIRLQSAEAGDGNAYRYGAHLFVENGLFEFYGLNPGEYTIESFGPSLSVTIQPGEVVVRDLITR